jgi:hypothetical protein
MREEETKRQIARYARFWNHSVVRGEHFKPRFLALVFSFSRPKESFSEDIFPEVALSTGWQIFSIVTRGIVFTF